MDRRDRRLFFSEALRLLICVVLVFITMGVWMTFEFSTYAMIAGVLLLQLWHETKYMRFFKKRNTIRSLCDAIIKYNDALHRGEDDEFGTKDSVSFTYFKDKSFKDEGSGAKHGRQTK